MTTTSRKPRRIALGLLLLGMLGGGLAVIWSGRAEANYRACSANLKTLNALYESFGGCILDLCGRPRPAYLVLTPERLEALPRAPDLRGLVDPGAPQDAAPRYLYTPAGFACLRHGYPPTHRDFDRSQPARAQLEARGIRDRDLLTRASTEPPGGSWTSWLKGAAPATR